MLQDRLLHPLCGFIVHDPGIHYFDDLPFPADPFLPARTPFFEVPQTWQLPDA